MMNTAILLLTLSAPPSWQVSERPPAYQVTVQDDYPAFHARIQKRAVGKPLIAYVGVPKPPRAEGVELNTTYLPVGVWYCWRGADGKLKYDSEPPAVEVPASRPKAQGFPTTGTTRAQYAAERSLPFPAGSRPANTFIRAVPVTLGGTGRVPC